jgi:hypothetical protein
MASKFARSFLPGFELDVESGGQMVESVGVEPRPTWHFVDSNGHGHFYQDRDEPYPTLRWVSEPCMMGHGDGCEGEGHYECKLCGEEIQPATQMAQPVWIDGPDAYRLTVVDAGGQRITYAFGEVQWKQLHAALLDAVQGTLDGFVVEISSSA